MTRDKIIRMAREAQRENFDDGGHWFSMEAKDLERFAALVAAAEREACAKVAENGMLGLTIAKAIRARGEK